MSASEELLSEACEGLPHTTRRMFGGRAYFAPNGGMFAGIVDDDQIIFKLADDKARGELIALGGHAWTYTGQNKPMTMREWIVPPSSFYDDPDELKAWARKAHRLVPPKLAKKKAAPKKKPTVKKR